MIRDYIVGKAHKRILDRVRCTCHMLSVYAEQGLFNYRCHENCVEYLRTHPDKKLDIIETIYVDGGIPILHYIVFDRDKETYLEVTIGWRADIIEYYFIRALTPCDHKTIMNEFNRALGYWLNEYVPRWQQWLFSIDRIA